MFQVYQSEVQVGGHECFKDVEGCHHCFIKFQFIGECLKKFKVCENCNVSLCLCYMGIYFLR